MFHSLVKVISGKAYFLVGFSSILLFLSSWSLLLRFNVLDERMVPSPIQVAEAFVTKLVDPNPDGSTLVIHILTSLGVSLTGFSIAVSIGIPLGLLMGWYKPVDKFIRPLFELIRPISPIAWIPLMILTLGIGLKAKAFIVFFAAFTPSVINCYTGIKLTPLPLINAAKTCGASSWQVFTKVAIPSAFPMIFAGIRLSLIYSWSVLVGAEMLASNSGLGYMILQGRQFSRADIIIVGMLTIGLLGALLTSLLSAIENNVLKRRGGR